MFYSIGYVEPDTSLMLAAGLGIAKAISSKRVDKRFAGEVMDDETVGLTQDVNTDHNSTVINYHQLQKGGKSQKIRRNLSD